MVQIVRSNKAFSLIEVLVAIVIIGISIMGLMEMSIVVMKNNLRNEMRNKAIELLSNHLQSLTSLPYDNISSGSNPYTEKVRNMDVEFDVVDNVTENISTHAKSISSQVRWSCCGKEYKYDVKTVVTKNE